MFSQSNSRRHAAIAEAINDVYWKKHYHVGKKIADIGFVWHPDKCKHPYKCKQFYSFIFACRSKPVHCFVNINYIHMFLYLVFPGLPLVLPSCWCHKFISHVHKVLCIIYVYIYTYIYWKAYNEIGRATNIMSHNSSARRSIFNASW